MVTNTNDGLSSGKAEYYDLILNKVFEQNKDLSLNLKYFNHMDKNFSYKFEGQPNQNNLIVKIRRIIEY